MDNKNQAVLSENVATGVSLQKSDIKKTVLGDYILEKLYPKKDLNRKAAVLAENVLSVKTLERFKSCGDFISHLTNSEMSVKRVHKSNMCGNRFCPICTWSKSKKDAIMISIVMQALKEEKGQEFILMTLTSPNVQENELVEEINKFNKAFKKMFDRKKIKKAINGYIRKLEITTDQERFITDELYKRKSEYFEKRGLKVGDNNPQYNTYNPHFHVILAVNKSYFTSRDYINQSEWLENWQDCMDNSNITQLDVKKVRSTPKGEIGAVLEVAKYSAKGNEIYHSQSVFEVFYKAMKGRQLITFNGLFKEYVKKFKDGELDRYKKEDENEYTHLLMSVWQKSKYENILKKLTPEEFEKFNRTAQHIEESDEVE